MKESENYTQIICLFDRSGSMSENNFITEVVGGFNNFVIEQQKVPGKAELTLISFDDRFETVFSKMDIMKVPQLSVDQVKPRGMTRLNDAIAHGITTAVNHPKTILLIQTDGMENFSTEYSTGRIKGMLAERKSFGWEIMFVGAGIDAFAQSDEYGLSRGETVSISKSDEGAVHGARKMSDYTVSYRTK